MMTREELEAALEAVGQTKANWEGPIVAAARKLLALMPEKCEHGKTRPHGWLTDEPLSDNWCSGKVYPPETVEKIAEAIDSISDEVWGYRGRQAVAVLDALGESE